MHKILSVIDGYKSFIVGIAAIVIGILFLTGVTTPAELTAYAQVVSDAVGTGFILAGAGFMALRSALNKLMK